MSCSWTKLWTVGSRHRFRNVRPPRWIFCIRSDYICNQRTDCSVFRTCLPENRKRFQITLCSSASRWRDRYRTGSRWIFYLRIFPLWIICSGKYSSQYYSGSRWTDYLLRTVSGINGNSRCKTAHIREQIRN